MPQRLAGREHEERAEVYWGKPLSEVTYDDIIGFLDLDRAEGENLDYKQAWADKHIRTVYAMVNTAGGDLIVGVGEWRDGDTNTNRPDLANVSGVERKPRDLAKSVATKVRSRTRPSLTLEVEAVQMPGTRDQMVLLIECRRAQRHHTRSGSARALRSLSGGATIPRAPG